MEIKNEAINFTLGANPEIIKEFLILIRDKYPIVDKANFFIEINAKASGANIAITNQRDFLSHFCTILKEKDLSIEQQRAQVSAAEEHLRRAVIESYQKGVEIKLLETLQAFEAYKTQVVPNQKKYPQLADSPEIEAIRTDLDQIRELRKKGRAAKALNIWTDDWEEGVNAYLEAFLKLEKLDKVLEIYLGKSSQIQEETNCIKKPKYSSDRLLKISIISVLFNIVLLGFVLGLLI